MSDAIGLFHLDLVRDRPGLSKLVLVGEAFVIGEDSWLAVALLFVQL